MLKLLNTYIRFCSLIWYGLHFRQLWNIEQIINSITPFLYYGCGFYIIMVPIHWHAFDIFVSWVIQCNGVVRATVNTVTTLVTRINNAGLNLMDLSCHLIQSQKTGGVMCNIWTIMLWTMLTMEQRNCWLCCQLAERSRTFRNLVEETKIDTHITIVPFGSMPSPIMQHYWFNTRVRTDGESVTYYNIYRTSLQVQRYLQDMHNGITSVKPTIFYT